MKKQVLGLLLACSIGATLAGCGCGAQNSEQDDPIVSVEEAEEEPEAKEPERITKVFEFYSDSEEDVLYNFPATVEEGGVTYTYTDDMALTTLGMRDTVQVVVYMNVEELEDVPDTLEHKSEETGRVYELANEQVYVKDYGLVTILVIDEVYYKDQVGKPSVPTKKTITYYDRDAGEDREIEGLLTSFEETSTGQWKSLLKVDGVFMAPSASSHLYELAGVNNVTVARDAATPIWAGYEQNVLSYLGLSDQYYRVTGAAWNGDQYEQDGYIMRNAVFTGDMFVASYQATYEAEREAEGYSTAVYYRTDAEGLDVAEEDITTVYKIQAEVVYESVPEGDE